MIKIILISGSIVVIFLITMLVIVAVDQQRHIKKGKPIRKIKIINHE